MVVIREPLEVDFFFDPKPLTKDEQKQISDFIKADKAKRKRKKISKISTHTKIEQPPSRERYPMIEIRSPKEFVSHENND